MTREEIKNTPELVDHLLDESVIEDSRNKLHERIDKICNFAIKALEQELCKDAISRKEVIDTIYRECSGVNLDIDFAKVLLLQRKIKALQSVRPKQKTGEWINGDCEGGNCNICGKYYAFYPESGSFNYCPNCGAKMESEEKE